MSVEVPDSFDGHNLYQDDHAHTHVLQSTLESEKHLMEKHPHGLVDRTHGFKTPTLPVPQRTVVHPRTSALLLAAQEDINASLHGTDNTDVALQTAASLAEIARLSQLLDAAAEWQGVHDACEELQGQQDDVKDRWALRKANLGNRAVWREHTEALTHALREGRAALQQHFAACSLQLPRLSSLAWQVPPSPSAP